ncbi:hypothetical protein DACRYDRAFT_23958 [Dacryopinax primogenitus]|uniref:Uncharacterized protein n=1 Tax=Dacryopinax primogenitus (strain DJM 731) TaxID=1858805 RepID=M5FTL2_DACPD|nr:uncharacterized protein DACRYDRAFT_23958 [Dacryopinax primogenitus]EJT99433.1 hypothetical protein DACRYDRAFT_23958 [Dacryopinax primogenitus]
MPELTRSPDTASGALSPMTWSSEPVLPLHGFGHAHSKVSTPDFVVSLAGDRLSFLDTEGDAGWLDMQHERSRELSPPSASTSSIATRPFLLPRMMEEYTSDSDVNDDVFGTCLSPSYPTLSRSVFESRTPDFRAAPATYSVHVLTEEQEESDSELHTAFAPSARQSRSPSASYPALLHPAAAQESDTYGGMLGPNPDRLSIVSSNSSMSSLGTLVGPTSEAFVVQQWELATSPDADVSVDPERDERAETPRPAPTPSQSRSTSRTPSTASNSSRQTNRIRRVPVPAYIPELEFERESEDSDAARMDNVGRPTPDGSVSAGMDTPIHEHGFDSGSPTTPSSANGMEDVDIVSSSPVSAIMGHAKEMCFELSVDAPTRPSLEKRASLPAPVGVDRKYSVREKTRRVWSGMRAVKVREMVRRIT